MNNALGELEKERIAKELLDFLARRNMSQKVAGTKLGVSVATINKICNGYSPEQRDRWDTIADKLWRKVEGQIQGISLGLDSSHSDNWVIVEDIAPFSDLRKILLSAKKYSETLGFIAPPGTGKSAIGKWCSDLDNFFHIKCSVIQNIQTFMREILKEIGVNAQGMTQGVMLKMIEETLVGKEKPILFLDEYDKVPDSVLKFTIDLYNRLEGKCALVIGATEFLQRKVRNGVLNDRQGYPELWSRIGGEWMHIQPADSFDVARVVTANGIEDELEIQEIVNKSQGDLRKVKSMVFKAKRRMEEEQLTNAA